MNPRRQLKWFQLLGVALFFFILSRLNLSEVGQQLMSFRAEWAAVYAASFLAMTVFKGLRWRAALSAQGTSLPVKKIIGITAVAIFLGSVTPGRLGELSKVAYLQRDNLSVSQSLPSVVLDRFYDLIFLVIFGCAGYLYFAGKVGSEYLPLLMVLGSIPFAIIGIFLFRKGVWSAVENLVRLLLPVRLFETLSREWGVFQTELSRMIGPSLFLMTSYSFLSFGCYFASIYAVATGFGVSISFVYLALCLSLSSLLSLIPISVGGLGTREAVFIALLGKVSVPAESAVSIALMDGVVFSLAISGISALLFSVASGKKSIGR